MLKDDFLIPTLFANLNLCCTDRTIMALWRTRTLTPDQKAQIAEEQEDQDDTSIMLEDAGANPDVEDTELCKVYTAELPINVSGQYSSHLSSIASLSIQRGSAASMYDARSEPTLPKPAKIAY